MSDMKCDDCGTPLKFYQGAVSYCPSCSSKEEAKQAVEEVERQAEKAE